MADFKSSVEFAFRRYIRQSIRKTDKLTKTEKEITLYLVNLWFYHKGGPKPYIHPSHGLIAKRIKCSVKTANRTTFKLRDLGILCVVGHASMKGKRAHEYVVNSQKLIAQFDSDNWQNVLSAFSEMSYQHRDKMSHRISNVDSDPVPRKVSNENVINLDEVRNG